MPGKRTYGLKGPLIFDASVLFNFGHRGELHDIIQELKNNFRLIITQSVRKESSGETNRAFYEKFISVYFEYYTGKPVKKYEKEITDITRTLGSGEIEVIVTALELNGTAVIDEKLARREAIKLNIEVTGTLGILKFALVNSWINNTRAVKIVDTIRKKGAYIPLRKRGQTFEEYFRFIEYDEISPPALR
jgi:predicted nucleic acid-binding protein